MSQMKNEILNKSLLELGEWTWLRQPSGDDLQSDRLTMELDCLSKKKLCDYSNSDIYLAVSQEKGLRFTVAEDMGGLVLSLRNAFQTAPVDLRKIRGVIEGERYDCRRKPGSGQRQPEQIIGGEIHENEL